MTIIEAIEQVDRQVVNNIEEEDKLKWLKDTDRSIYSSIISHSNITLTPPVWDDYDLETVLLVPEPYSELYRWYLEMQIHGINGESARYNIAAAKYNYALQTYIDYVNREAGIAHVTRMRWW